MVAEAAHLRRLQELRVAASARKRQSPLLGASGGPSCVQKRGPSNPPRRPQIESQEQDLPEGGGNFAGRGEVPDNGAPLSQLGMFKLMADSMAMAIEKVEKRCKRPSPLSSVDGVPTSFLRLHNLCINFNMGKCPDSGSHKHSHIIDRYLHHQCGACKKAGKTDTTHGSHELDRCPKRQVFRRK